MKRVGVWLCVLALALPAAVLPSPRLACAAAAADLRTIPKKDRPGIRYLLRNARNNADLDLALTLQLNLLSREGKPAAPVLVTPWLYRINLGHFDLPLHVWERLARTDVFFHHPRKYLVSVTDDEVWPGGSVRSGRFFERGVYLVKRRPGQTVRGEPAFWLDPDDISYLRLQTYSEAPILDAAWFVVQTARQLSIRNEEEGTGYYDFMGFKDRKAFLDFVGLREKDAIKRLQEWRAVIERSGVSQQNRQVVRFRGTTGPVWVTLDVFKQAGRGVARRNLRRDEFAHDAEEWFGFNYFGLPVTFLADAKGVAQASAPDKVGGDSSPLNVGRDSRIHANLSCIRCHGARLKDDRWLRSLDDWTRRNDRLRLQDPNPKVALELARQYMSDLNWELNRDRDRYARAAALVSRTKAKPAGLTIYELSLAYSRMWNDYVEAPVTLVDAAREWGVTPARLVRSLRLLETYKGGSDLVLSSYLDNPPQPLTRLEFEDSYALGAALIRGVIPVELIEKHRLRR